MIKLFLRTAFVGLFSVILTSCYTQRVVYNFTPVQFQKKEIIPSSTDDVWASVVDILSEAGISIDIIDKGSGLIMTGRYYFKPSFQAEDGTLFNDADIAVQYANYCKNAAGAPASMRASAKWNIRVRADKEQRTVVTINITDITPEVLETRYSGYVPYNTWIKHPELQASSTGRFEKQVINLIKRQLNIVAEDVAPLERVEKAQD